MLDHFTLSFGYFIFCRLHHMKTPKSNRLVSGEFTGCVITAALTPLFFNSLRNSVTEKNEYSHQRHKRQHNGTNNTPLGSLLGLPVELSNGIAVQEKHKTTIKCTYTGASRASKLAAWEVLHKNQNLTDLSSYGVNTKQQSNLHTQGLQGHPNWLFGRFCIGNRT